MRVSIGADYVNEYVREAYLGEEPVAEIWLGNVKLYPDEEGLVTAIEVELPGDELTLAKWRAALSCAEAGGASWTKYIKLVAGDTESRVGATHNGFPLTACTGSARNRFEFDKYSAPSFSSLMIGDEVLVEVKMEDATLPKFALGGENGSGTRDYDVPFMPGLWLQLGYWKGQKRNSAYAKVTLTGLASGTVHISERVMSHGHWRGYANWKIYPTESANKAITGDTGFRISISSGNAAGGANAVPHIPELKFTMRCKVTAIFIDQQTS